MRRVVKHLIHQVVTHIGTRRIGNFHWYACRQDSLCDRFDWQCRKISRRPMWLNRYIKGLLPRCIRYSGVIYIDRHAFNRNISSPTCQTGA